ncbi:MAG TPA: VIT domain-containing protein [Pirellulales bacterium]|nr:VIT domain-containing protein [Pirellulales bacterium]
MKRYLLTPVLVMAFAAAAQARGLLIPVEPELAALAMVNHHVDVTLEDQVAVTKVEQTFRNHTSRRLEATYVFPVPPGASVQEFAMWVNGHRVKGELIKADKAREIYTSIVRQTKNPALLDYIGSDMLSMKIFPVPPQGDQKVEVRFTAIAKRQHELVEYVYPLTTDHLAPSTLEEFRITLTLKSQQPIGSIYSPTHDVTIYQANNHEALVRFEQKGAQLDRDFQLFYTTSGQDIGLTAVEHRPITDEDGYVMLLVSPRAELPKNQKVPRDIVFVVDTSGSMMEDKKMEQAQQALRHCLTGLTDDDRFGLIQFATTVNRYRGELVPANEEHIKRGKGWVADLYAGGGTAIHQALTSALDMRTDDVDRMFTIVFFTDGQPTIGETNTETILADITQDSSTNTRIFSFGVGNDLNAVFLDQIAEKTRAVNRFVRPGENLEAKVASFFNKINHPVLANLKLQATGDVQLAEIYPPQLPDLFHGDQLVVLGRYQGSGRASLVLEGKVGIHKKQFEYDIDFLDHADDKPFVEELWAQRKVGYLLDQIRINGEQEELVDAVVQLAKNYGITTPYTSYLIMPDSPLQLASAEGSGFGGRLHRHDTPDALATDEEGGRRENLEQFAKRVQGKPGAQYASRGDYQDRSYDELDRKLAKKAANQASAPSANDDATRQRVHRAKERKSALDVAHGNFRNGNWRANHVNKLGVDLAVSTNNLKYQQQLAATAIRRVANRNCMEYGGVWIDEAYSAKTPTLAVKAQSDAYFRILERQPQMKKVFGLGNHVLWITPNGTGLVIDAVDGKDQLKDREIDMLFASK